MENTNISQSEIVQGQSINRGKRQLNKQKILWLFSFFVSFAIVYMTFIGSIFNFDNPINVEIKNGQSLKTIALNLEDRGVVWSSSLLSTIVILIGGESHIVSGIYSFEKKEGAYFVAKRIAEGKTNIKSTKVTFPEGFSSTQISKRLVEVFPNFSEEEFLRLAKEKEGYLFPDTYFFLPNLTPLEVVEKLESTFWQKVEKQFGFKMDDKEKLKDTIILASILEEEVQSLEDKKIVADLFLRRMKIGMPLQADSTLAYVTGRDSLSLTVDDLKSDSPYNTYTNRGFPPTPISNPGLESIEAVLNPTPNKFLYFLTDEEGKVYYAKTFEEHKLNKAKYLK